MPTVRGNHYDSVKDSDRREEAYSHYCGKTVFASANSIILFVVSCVGSAKMPTVL